VASAHVREAQSALDETQLRAPSDGVILDVLRREGEAARTIDGQPAVLFADDSAVRVRAEIDERFVGKVDRRDVPADNYGSERDLRILARHRKATGGTRSPRGSRTLGQWMSIRQTTRKNGVPLRDFVTGLYESHRHGLPPPSVFN
jgi:hypothetical protein